MKKKILRIVGAALMIVFFSQFSAEPNPSFTPLIVGGISIFGAVGCFIASYEER
jgi:prolipoprotein diacylglyceryltransferase